MALLDKMIVLSVIVMFGITGLTLYNIHKFMPIERSCEDDFRMIERCVCIPEGSNYSFLAGADRLKELSKNGEG